MIQSAEEFLRLRESEREEEYQRAAKEPASLNVWKEVIERYSYMRKWVAYNKTVPNEILQILAQDADPEVRRMVAMRRSAGEEILERLSDDVEETVKNSVLHNPKITKKILEKFLYDNSKIIRISARKKIKELELGTRRRP